MYTKKQQAANLIKAMKEKPKLGSGQRFKNLVKDLKKKKVKNPGALAAWVGINKYGKAAMTKMALKGRK
jgi:hypothetical protein